ncbi:MAG: hypothetical protein KY467_14270 [Gemmatimonadetes bacterium]|nr:hypothetical protein [Gemmatimonadota bacterium]
MRRKASRRTGCAPLPTCGRPTTGETAACEEVVDAYIRFYRRDAAQEIEFFHRLSLTDAIKHAGLCISPNGKRHPHQCRIPRSVLAEGERNLQACAAELAASPTFARLHEIVRRELLGIHGIGVLAVYDVATRLGAHLGLKPTRVYLHAGTAQGARALGLNHRRESLAMEELPPAFRRLSPPEAEDCLCIFKGALASAAE